MLIAVVVAALGLAVAAASVMAVYRLVPPLQASSEAMSDDASQAILAEWEADFIEAIQRAEQERRDEIDALRQLMLKQRLEISKLRREAREHRIRQARADTRAHELEQRRRRAGNEARHLSELPVAALLQEHSEAG
jgi:hypothetical protein